MSDCNVADRLLHSPAISAIISCRAMTTNSTKQDVRPYTLHKKKIIRQDIFKVLPDYLNKK